MVEWMYENNIFINSPELMEHAIRREKIDILEWLLKKGFQKPNLSEFDFFYTAKNLPLFKWVVTNFEIIPRISAFNYDFILGDGCFNCSEARKFLWQRHQNEWST
jgi:hypothetical protein